MKRVVVIDGARTPFLRSATNYMDLMTYQLGAAAIRGVLTKTGIDPNKIDTVIMGTVISNVKTSNVARESALSAGIPNTVPCHTVTQACISANQAISSGVEKIQTGQADIVIAGGTDSISDAPIMFRKQMRKKLMNAQKLKGIGDTIKFVFSLEIADFKPEAPAVAEFLTGRTMGQDCDILAARYGATRKEQDELAVRSHKMAAAAIEKGYLQKEITPVELPPNFKPVKLDNGVRGETTYEKMASLKPAFTKPHGTLTAANSTFLTDGAAAVLLMSEEKAKELGLTPKAYIHSYTFAATDPGEELLLGPTYAISQLFDKTGLTMDQMDVIELHEAFAGQVVANIKCMASAEFAKTKLGKDKPVGVVNMDKLNLWGGSLAIGHPFGATGARLVTTAANRLHAENGRYALLSACAAGAHGHAMILERA
jgi:acetyl-CoA acyltransferase